MSEPDPEAQARLLALADLQADAHALVGPTLDPRWEWINVTTYGGGPEYVKGACRHLTPVEVRSTVTGELLAHLCPDCDAQLPAAERPDGYPPIGLTGGE